MTGSTAFFLAFSALIALVGLFAAGMAHDYLQFFGLALFGFGVLFGYSCIKRHYDAREAARH
ncbi:hypothetical protein [Paracraurococcus ruber]|uniref:Uncharacterized protein n=1 Tax=Paracraurococcus ruber TaxID=77675 RepID=A0ABS1CXX7_9PROT|nr:hypothetical protein [Paracraurococcus ruber]MBK1659393.1 hypothetical protein [Paracraurococcus ruber]TDG30486.1 hypothetical protein E2C05_14245 [Paracraurococcus ruber]